jgi:hypothetical protein
MAWQRICKNGKVKEKHTKVSQKQEIKCRIRRAAESRSTANCT